MAMTAVAGHFGDGIRSDARVSVESAGSPSLEIRSSVQALYGGAIRDSVQNVLQEFGDPSLAILVEDSGALPFALEARLRAAIAGCLGVPVPTQPSRKVSPRRERARRTRLYLPADQPKLLPNADLYRPDAVILDLEDSVPEEEKDSARIMAAHALAHLEFGGAERMVRINSGEMGLRDLSALAHAGAEVFLVPKTEAAEDLIELSATLESLNSPALLLPILESARGVAQAESVAGASERVVAITIGLEDYTADIGAERTPQGEESAWALGRLVNAARAAGISPLASVYPYVDDDGGLFEYAKRMRGLGFDGVGCIHPRQIRVVHQAFMPTDDELARAKRIVAEFEAAQRAGKAAWTVDGRMVDRPAVLRALNTIERAKP